MKYDEAGNRTSLTDPDAGTSTWEYDNNGRVTRHTDARGKVTQTTYDVFGNKQQENVDGSITRYYYDTPRKHVVWESCNGHVRRFDFDEYGRLKRSGTYIVNSEGTIFNTRTYDSYGRVMKHNYTFGVNATYGFDEYGYKTWVKVNGTNAWRLLEHTGRREKYLTLNDSVQTLRRYDDAGRLTRQSRKGTGLAQFFDSLTYVYNAATSNLVEAKQSNSSYSNIYFYDNLDRLVSSGIKYNNGGTATIQAMTYGADGNILSKTEIGDYSYSSSKPHAVTGVENIGGIIPQTPQSITYNAYGKVTHITEGDHTFDIDYGTDHQRWRSTLTDSLNNVVRSIRYCEDMDIVTRGDTSLLVLYVDGGVIFVRERDNSLAPSRLYHLTTDRLGSIIDIVDGKGHKLFSNSYDAWGKPSDWQSSNWFLRGYTGHEMIPEMRLVNMNGRMYDPALGRFLSPDDYVQMPLSPQGYNRYTYCGNNPLRYTDPSGEIFGLGHLLSAGFGFISGYLTNALFTGNWGWKSVQSGLLSAASCTIGLPKGATTIGKDTWSHIGIHAFNDFVGKAFPGASLNLGKHFAFGFAPTFCFARGGLTGGLGMSVNYHNNNFGIGIGVCMTNHYTSASANVSYKDFGVGYSYTSFPEGDFFDNQIGSQGVGNVGFTYKDWGFNFSNDILGDGEDRWRTFAAELRYKDFTIGVMAGTNYGKVDSKNDYSEYTCKNAGKYEMWGNGLVYYAPAWLGIRSGNQITRVGYSAPFFQDITQNRFHKLMHDLGLGTAKFYHNYTQLSRGLCAYHGYYNPDIIWAR